MWALALFSQHGHVFIILTTAITLNRHGITNIETSRQAAEALRPFAGNFAATLFTLGIVGVGFLAIPTLAGSTAYAFAETLGWRQGLNKKLRQARWFYALILGSTGAGIALDFIGINPVKALYWTAVINGLLAPFLLVAILVVAADNKLMQNQPSSRLGGLSWQSPQWPCSPQALRCLLYRSQILLYQSRILTSMDSSQPLQSEQLYTDLASIRGSLDHGASTRSLSVLAAKSASAPAGNRRMIRQEDFYAYHPISASISGIGHTGHRVRSDWRKDRKSVHPRCPSMSSQFARRWLSLDTRLLGPMTTAFPITTGFLAHG